MEKNNKTLNVPHLRFPEFSGEWETGKIKQVCDIATGNKNTQDKSDDGIYPFYVRSQTVERINSWSFDGEAILTAGDGVGVGKVFHYSIGKIGVHQRVYILSNFTCDSKYLFHYFSSRFYTRVKRMSAKNSVDSVRMEMIADMPIYLASKDEQRKIGYLLSLLNERIETQKKIIEDLKKLKDAINNSLHNNINEFQLFSFNELGNDYSGLTGKSSDDFGSGLPYISYLNVFRNDIVTDGQFDCVKVSKTEKQNVVSYGDLLFTLSSETPSEVGIGAIYLGKTNPIYLNSFCFGVHLSNQENIYGPYLAYFVTSQYFRKTILPFAQGSTRYNLMKSDFMKHKFRFPNMATQKAIYNTLHTLSEKIQNEEVCLNKYTEQKQYLLARLFI